MYVRAALEARPTPRRAVCNTAVLYSTLKSILKRAKLAYNFEQLQVVINAVGKESENPRFVFCNVQYRRAGMLNSLETLWVMRQAPDPPKKFGEPWDGNRIVGNSAASLINYIMKQQGKDPPITSIQAYQPNTENKTKPEKDCYCGYCGRPPNVQGMGGTPPFFRWCRCSRCVVTRYCSKKCRENHWKFGHWNECTPLWLVP